MYALPAVLLVIALLAVLRRDAGVAWTAGVLLANWGINTVSVLITSDSAPWLIFMVIDYLAAIGLFAFYESRWQAAVIALYAVELVFHAAYGASNAGAWAQYRYWWTLFFASWAQAVAVGGWLCCEMVRHHHRASRRASPDLAIAREETRS